MSVTRTKTVRSPLSVTKYTAPSHRRSAVDQILQGTASGNNYNRRLGKLSDNLVSLSRNMSKMSASQRKTLSAIRTNSTAIHSNAQDIDTSSNVISGSINELTTADNKMNTNIKNLNNILARYTSYVKYSGIAITTALVGVMAVLIF